MRTTLLALTLAAWPALSSLPVRASSGASGQEAPPPVKDTKALRAFFAENCVKCHGLDGSATSPDGKRLKGQDFTNQGEMAQKRDAKLAKTIRRGVFFGKAMPSFKDKLSEAEALAMVTEVVRKAEKGKAIK